MTEVFVKTRWFEDLLMVEGTYEPAERGSFEDGLQMEPDIPASFVVEAIFLNNLEITEVFNDKAVEEVEELAYQALENGEDDYDPEDND